MGKAAQKVSNKAVKGKKGSNKFVLNCSLPVGDNVIVLNDFTDFLQQKIKVDGKTGNLANTVTVSKDKNNVVVEAKIDFSKRYLKYLTKKYMKKQQLRDYLRVVATNKNTYELRYLQLDAEGAEE
uniref:Large ribosomal subunit protein eL22 n=1 Tax=Favella ehrenbergii TaxID=182087 RepID=A0A7S3MT67_9SPIT|mmetsp:Transcript_5769/g.7788  ORF Transcript_5769/g.7788 Transcript_5769/m.7788 type:complete len:125 (-) Transcript_5769:145-519(-)|eukprot:CAMPEP_0170450586 /NCGR_PEP_ID=MMETSP0123-20130129/71_1 /TAXON_ID=182087 /ORGANISM="Favella ehrenbergii, Strain Fehren 1" /LENGTH=124 /DNA_ID=CAMNT_0010711913 /DNA_START=35 /DNA_END=409 /DNA_ORIENTATION=+